MRAGTENVYGIVGFAKASETQSPREAFSSLQELLVVLAKTVHSFGGIVDKSLGDGLLCYFGFYCEGMEWIGDHADRAIECARQIQLDNVQRMVMAERHGKPIYPLRIGINSAAVYIGDVGYSDRIDFTLRRDVKTSAQGKSSAWNRYVRRVGDVARECRASDKRLVRPRADGTGVGASIASRDRPDMSSNDTLGCAT